MVESDRSRFAVEIMAPLAEVFGEISALTIHAWWMALQEYPFEAIRVAALSCLRSVRSRTDDEGHHWRALWPTPGDVIAVMEQGAEARQEQRDTRKALPEPRGDPEVARANLVAVKELLDKTVQRLPKAPSLRGDSQDPYRPGAPTWPMSEDNWRARWDLYKLDPEYKVVADAIPERLRIQFAEEDRKRETGLDGQAVSLKVPS